MIAMPDSVTPGNLPDGYPAYLAYTDGDWPTEDAVREAHPAAQILTYTVTGKGAVADGCDREAGDLTPAQAAAWLHLRIQAGQQRPVLYASRDNVPPVLSILSGLNVARQQIRIHSAHYEWKPGGAAEHVCGPATCEASFQADGTQWTDTFPGTGGSTIDMSTLADDFFGPPPDWTFYPVRSLKVTGTGPHSAAFTWDSPAGPAGAEAVNHYQLTVRHQGEDVAEPADVPKGGNPEAYQWNNLVPGTDYEFLGRAVAVNGHAGPWAAVSFKTTA